MASDFDRIRDLDTTITSIQDRLPMLAQIARSAAEAFAPDGQYMRGVIAEHVKRGQKVPEQAATFAAQQHARLNRIADKLQEARRVLMGI